MSDHDPLCPKSAEAHPYVGGQCHCALIMRVRADEREQIRWEDGNSLRMVMASHDALLAHAEAVAAKLVEVICDDEHWRREAVFTVIRRLIAERDAAHAEVVALREQIAAMEQRWSCQTCGQSPVWTECGNARCKVKVHPYCACNRDDEVDGHWCDEGCPCEVLADVRAKVKGLRDEAILARRGTVAENGLDTVPSAWHNGRTSLADAVLALIEEAQHG